MHPTALGVWKQKLRAVVDRIGFSEDSDDDGNITAEGYEEIPAFAAEVLKTKKDWLRAEDIYLLLFQRSRAFAHDHVAPHERHGSLRELLGEGLDPLVNEVVEFLSSIPRKYFGYAPLPRFFGLKLSGVTLAPGITLIDVRDEKNYEHIAAQAPMRGALAQALSPPVPFLKVECDGYYEASPKSSAAAAMLARIKQWLSLSTTLDLLETSPGLGDLLVGLPGEHRLSIAVRDERSGKLLNDLNISGTLSRALSYAHINPSRTPLSSSDKSIEMSLDGLEATFATVSRCMTNPEQNRDLMTGSEWLFDSVNEENNTLAYLYAAIGLEATLGSRQEAVAASLADRLSYLVGTSRKSRVEIQDKFHRFYKHRSNIVHGKAARLGHVEQELMGWGQAMLSAALREELGLLD